MSVISTYQWVSHVRCAAFVLISEQHGWHKAAITH